MRISRRRTQSGSAALEFGLCVPFLLVFLMGMVEVGFAMYQAMQVQNAVEAGALYASRNPWSASEIAAAVEEATGTAGIAASPAPAQFCGCPTASGVAAATCGNNCVDGTAAGQYARISASLTHQTILPYPGLPLPSSITAQSVVRLK